MPIFRSKSHQSQNSIENVKLTSKDIQQYKQHTANVNDPILSAVNEMQPFEQANQLSPRNVAGGEANRSSYLSQNSANLNDIFGNKIVQRDNSNPTRDRNERPLDTIRSFEYAITGDLFFKEQLESRKIGWGFHNDFPNYTTNPYASPPQSNNSFSPGNNMNYGAPQQNNPIMFNNASTYGQPTYAKNSSNIDVAPVEKKKRGLFGRKKK